MVFGLFKKKPVNEGMENQQPISATKPAPESAHEPAPVAEENTTSTEPVVAAAAEQSVTTVDTSKQPPSEAGIDNEPVSKEASAPEQPEVLGQMDTIKATREDVIAAYKIFLGRLPESMVVVDQRVGVAPAALLVDFLASKEFLDQAPKAQLVLAVAKKILDERKKVAANESSVPGADATVPASVSASAEIAPPVQSQPSA